MCTLPKPPAGRALSEGKEAPQAAFPSWCFPAQTKRRTEVLILFLVVKEYHVDNDVDDHSAEISLKADDETRVKTFDEFTTAILDNVQLVEKFREMLIKIKKFVEIINI